MTAKTYEGKAKRVTVVEGGEVQVFFKDDATAFNAQKHAQIAGKGEINSQISELLFAYLHSKGISTHFKRRHNACTLVCRQAQMLALEVVVRFVVDGSLAKRTGLPAGTPVDPPVIEFYYKRDDLADPMVNFDHIRLLKLATAEEVASLSGAGLKVAQQLRALFAAVGITLVDLKLEYGRTGEGLMLCDEISPDTCRLHDATSGQAFDKDLFRFDRGDLMAGYREVHRRLKGALTAPADADGVEDV